jgi:hypothetical protein
MRALTVCGVAVGVAGAGAAAWAAEAQAGRLDFSPLGQVKLYPMADSGVDPLSNSVGTDVGGVPLNTDPVSSVFQGGLPVNSLPVVGGLLNQGS